jgi:orotidine-5'-phosphate decarboxylase
MLTFYEMLEAQWQSGRFLCVGLDPDYDKLPEPLRRKPVGPALFEFNRAIIEATAGHACAFKPNSAFYEGYGAEGWTALVQTVSFIRDHYPEHPVILDAKRADIGNTNLGYVRAAFEILKAHAITVHPYLGEEALQPFLTNPAYGVLVLCHTSNPGAGEFQRLKLQNGQELYQYVAAQVSRVWNTHQNCGLIVGATYPEQLAEVRMIAGDIPVLIPGIGAQGGDIEVTVANGISSRGKGMIINASRSILYAASGADYMTAAGAEAARLDQAIRAAILLVGQK